MHVPVGSIFDRRLEVDDGGKKNRMHFFCFHGLISSGFEASQGACAVWQFHMDKINSW